MRNPALDAMDVLIGEWALTLDDAFFLTPEEQPMRGDAVIRWLGEAFIEMVGDLHNQEDGQPTWHFVFGRSDVHDQLYALSHDPRPVARLFRMTFADGEWTMLREDPDFHQRMVATVVSPDRIEGRWEASDDAGQTWRKDFDLTFDRIGPG